MNEVDRFYDHMMREKDVEFGEPASEQDIAAFEARFGITLPTDIHAYFQKINGVFIGGYFISLLPLAEWELYVNIDPNYIRQVLDDADQYILFGTYDISVWHWLIRLDSISETKTPVFVHYDKLIKVADSFSGFLEIFRTKNPEDLLGYT